MSFVPDQWYRWGSNLYSGTELLQSRRWQAEDWRAATMLFDHSLLRPVVRKIATCKQCGFIQTRDYWRVSEKLWRNVAGKPVCDDHDHSCPNGCGRWLQQRTVRGKVSQKPCTDECRSARGHLCVCSCVGKYHGEAWRSVPVF